MKTVPLGKTLAPAILQAAITKQFREGSETLCGRSGVPRSPLSAFHPSVLSGSLGSSRVPMERLQWGQYPCWCTLITLRWHFSFAFVSHHPACSVHPSFLPSGKMQLSAKQKYPHNSPGTSGHCSSPLVAPLTAAMSSPAPSGP